MQVIIGIIALVSMAAGVCISIVAWDQRDIFISVAGAAFLIGAALVLIIH